mmetsp:Transcript_15427/g.48574  ORF Transcript_15427/g.48574 Transcript_15427/m.48574 type:complete len:253 (-) Transcript_15427:454-1212(-)
MPSLRPPLKCSTVEEESGLHPLALLLGTALYPAQGRNMTSIICLVSTTLILKGLWDLRDLVKAVALVSKGGVAYCATVFITASLSPSKPTPLPAAIIAPVAARQKVCARCTCALWTMRMPISIGCLALEGSTVRAMAKPPLLSTSRGRRKNTSVSMKTRCGRSPCTVVVSCAVAACSISRYCSSACMRCSMRWSFSPKAWSATTRCTLTCGPSSSMIDRSVVESVIRTILALGWYILADWKHMRTLLSALSS